MKYSYFKHCFQSQPVTGLVKRSLHMRQQDAKALAYTSLVRLHLEYASTAWDPHTDSNKYKLEAVQHRVARFVTQLQLEDTGNVNSSRTRLENP